MTPNLPCRLLAVAALTISTLSPAQADETASFAVDTTVRLLSDVRSRAISDSAGRPAVRLTVEAAHESGLIGLLELNTVSKRQFLEGRGVGAVLGLGYRFGDPEAWHFGVGAAAELFPGAHYDAPHAFDAATFTPGDFRRTRYDSQFLMLEAGWGALEGRLMGVVSGTYRGIDTGGVCATLLQLNSDPTVGLGCYARGEHGSRGTLLADLSYKWRLNPATTLTLHAGRQQVRHFSEADVDDVSVALSHRRWGMEFTAEWLGSRTQARELYLVQDGSRLRATDNNTLVVSIAHKF